MFQLPKLSPHALFSIFKLVIIFNHQSPKQSKYLLVLSKFIFYHSIISLLQLEHYGLFKVSMLPPKMHLFIKFFILPKHFKSFYFALKQVFSYFHQLHFLILTIYFILFNLILHHFKLLELHRIYLFHLKCYLFSKIRN